MSAAELPKFKFTRRQIIVGGLAAGLGLTALGGFGSYAWLISDAPGGGLKTFSAAQHRTAVALFEAIFPAQEGIPSLAHGLAIALDTFAFDEPGHNRRDLALALGLIEAGPLLFSGRFVRFSALSEAERLAQVHAWMESDLPIRRKIMVVFRKFGCMVYFGGSNALWSHIGYADTRLPAEKPVGVLP